MLFCAHISSSLSVCSKSGSSDCSHVMAIRSTALVTKHSQTAPENAYFVYIHIEVRLLEHVAVLFFCEHCVLSCGLVGHAIPFVEVKSIDLPLVLIVAIVKLPIFLMSLSRNDFLFVT